MTPHKRFVVAALLALVLGVPMGWLGYLAILPTETLIAAGTRDLLRLHSPEVVRWYLRHVKHVDRDERTRNGLTLVQYTLGGYESRAIDSAQVERNRATLEIATIFVERGASLDAVDRHLGFTALHTAILARNLEVVRFLLVKGANVNAPISEEGGSAFSGMTPLRFTKTLMGKTGAPASDLQPILEAVVAAGGHE